MLFNSCEYLSLQVKCLVSHGRGKCYFGNQGLVTSWHKNRSTTACGFVHGQQWRNALAEQMQSHWVFKYDLVKITLLTYCEAAALGVSSGLWYVSPGRGWSSSATGHLTNPVEKWTAYKFLLCDYLVVSPKRLNKLLLSAVESSVRKILFTSFLFSSTLYI